MPKPAPKREEVKLAEFREDVDNSKSRVAQCDPIIYRKYKDHPGCHNPPEAGEEMPGRFELGVARRNGTIEDVLEKTTAAAQETKRCEQKSIVQLAMD